MSQQIPERIPGGGVDLSHLAARGRGAEPGPAGAGQVGAGHAGGAGAGAAGAGGIVEVPSLVLDVTDQLFEQVAQLSATVPVVFDLWAEWCEPCKTLGPILERVTQEFGGRVLLAKVDVEANPGLAQAFQAQSIPTVVALVAGRPVPLFQGALPEDQVRDFFERLLELAVQQGVSGRVAATDAQSDETETPAEPEIPEAHRPAVEAAEAGDYARAVAEWEQVLKQAPADAEARAALVQVKLLHRLQGRTMDEIRTAAAGLPEDLDAQMLVADLDVSGGHIEDGFLRLLDLYTARSEEDDRTRIRERLLELFEVVGVTDPRVVTARRQLANLLY
ncbi:tetratricopeptide repeat protein [Leucobacter sp. GX24907]